MYHVVNNPKRWPVLIIGFNPKTDLFSVESVETHCGYFVDRGDLVGDYRNYGEVLTQILAGCEKPVLVFVDEVAGKEIDVIWNANIILF